MGESLGKEVSPNYHSHVKHLAQLCEGDDMDINDRGSLARLSTHLPELPKYSYWYLMEALIMRAMTLFSSQ